MKSPFNLQNITQYQEWRKGKFDNAINFNSANIDFLIDIKDTSQLTSLEKKTILDSCKQNSMCLYRITQETQNTKNSIHELAQQIGLNDLDSNICADNDSLTSITKTEHKGQHEYIPYSNKRLSWHTDGYYNKDDKQIHSMLLHCARPAKDGGESFLMDHEIAYILLRDENPDFIKALMQADAMTIPANILDGKVIREAQSGPVFSIDKQEQLHMRYSARKRNIEWKQSTPILEAVEYLDNLLDSDTPFIGKYMLKAGEGLICRNILHRRSSFEDYNETDKKRLLYRGRYFDCLPLSI